ncbi:Protein kinase of the Mitotic Exit Network [Tritrichomonas musculus]|uniref:Protein kinase of the Mitotic Exit Network n=1 Tax=Tritrichomonas musculus TaxID=1915356 RepID=A0ABR2GRK8_9EUKA
MSETTNFVDLNRFEVLDLIGNGAFSKVFRIQEKSSKQIYAAKVLNYEITDEEEDTEESLLILREINLMSSLNHRSILGFVAFSPKSFDNSPNPTIITDYAPNGSLHDILKLELSGLSPPKWDLTTN